MLICPGSLLPAFSAFGSTLPRPRPTRQAPIQSENCVMFIIKAISMFPPRQMMELAIIKVFAWKHLARKIEIIPEMARKITYKVTKLLASLAVQPKQFTVNVIPRPPNVASTVNPRNTETERSTDKHNETKLQLCWSCGWCKDGVSVCPSTSCREKHNLQPVWSQETNCKIIPTMQQLPNKK